MRKKGIALRLAGGLLTLWLVTSCAGGPVVIDPSVPLEQSSTLIFANSSITEFDGAKTGPKWWSEAGSKELVIPAGSHTFQLYQKGGGVGFETHTTADTLYNFLPGHTYMLTISRHQQYAHIFDVTFSKGEMTPDPSSPDATPFEGRWVHANDQDSWIVFCKDEFIVARKGKDYVRGSFTYDEKTVTMTFVGIYSKGKWVPSYFGTEEAAWAGTVLNIPGDNIALKRTEFRQSELRKAQ
jgi:hypothetical protein